MVTDLERAIWATAEPLRATRFAQILQNARKGSRDPVLPGPDDATQGWELSFDPAIQRTLAGVMALGMDRRSPPDIDSVWFRWNLEAKNAMARLAAKCWAGIDSNRRRVFIDEDNLQPLWGRRVMYDLRSDPPGRNLDFEGLSTPKVRACLKTVYEAARATPAYANALSADRELERSRDKVLTWARLAQKGDDAFKAAIGELTVGEGSQRALDIVRTIYAGTSVEHIATAYRRYNHLVQHIVWSILGLAEIIPEPFRLAETVGTLRYTHATDGSPLIRVTSASSATPSFRATYPLWLDTGTPLDGLHVIVGYRMSLGPALGTDFDMIPIRWSAGYWPDDETS